MASNWRSQLTGWFQLAKMRLTTSLSNAIKNLPAVADATANGNRTIDPNHEFVALTKPSGRFYDLA